MRPLLQVKDKAFILKTTRYGEADLIVQALNLQGARLNLFARSALKSKKRFGGGVLEPTHYVSLLYQDKSNKGANDQRLHTLNEASLIQGFEALRTDYDRLQAALEAVRLVSEMTREGDTESEDLFNLLGNGLRAIETSPALDKVMIHFAVKLLTQQGVLGHEELENRIMNAPISAHDELEIDAQGWKAVRQRTDRALREYLQR